MQGRNMENRGKFRRSLKFNFFSYPVEKLLKKAVLDNDLILNDYQYFVKLLMKKGKRRKAINLFIKILFNIKKKGLNPNEIIRKCIINLNPKFGFKRKMVAGRYQFLPVAFSKSKSRKIALKYILMISEKFNTSSTEKDYINSIVSELINTANNYSQSIVLKNLMELQVILLKSNIRFYKRKRLKREWQKVDWS